MYLSSDEKTPVLTAIYTNSSFTLLLLLYIAEIICIENMNTREERERKAKLKLNFKKDMVWECMYEGKSPFELNAVDFSVRMTSASNSFWTYDCE